MSVRKGFGSRTHSSSFLTVFGQVFFCIWL